MKVCGLYNFPTTTMIYCKVFALHSKPQSWLKDNTFCCPGFTNKVITQFTLSEHKRQTYPDSGDRILI